MLPENNFDIGILINPKYNIKNSNYIDSKNIFHGCQNGSLGNLGIIRALCLPYDLPTTHLSTGFHFPQL